MNGRDVHRVYAAVRNELCAEPTVSGNEVDRRLRAAGSGFWRNDVLEAVRVLRSMPGIPPGRGPGRPRKSVQARDSDMREGAAGFSSTGDAHARVSEAGS